MSIDAQRTTTNVLLFLILVALVGGGSAITGLVQAGFWAICGLLALFVGYLVLKFGVGVIAEIATNLVAIVVTAAQFLRKIVVGLAGLVRLLVITRRWPSAGAGDTGWVADKMTTLLVITRRWPSAVADKMTTLLVWIALLPVLPLYAGWRAVRIVRAESHDGVLDAMLAWVAYGLTILVLTIFWGVGWLLVYVQLIGQL